MSPTIASNPTSLAGGGASTTTTSVAGANGGGAPAALPVAGSTVAGAAGGGAAGVDTLGPLIAQVTAAVESLKQALAGGGLLGATAPLEGGGPGAGAGAVGDAGGCGCGMPGCGGGHAPTQTPPTPTQAPEQKGDKGTGDDKAEGPGKGKGKGKGHGKGRGKGHDRHDHGTPAQGTPAQGTPPANKPEGKPADKDRETPPAGGGSKGGPDGTGNGTFDPTARYQGVTSEGWWHWQAPSNTWVKSDKGDSLAKYLVKDGNGWKVGTPPSTSGSGGFDPTARYQGVTSEGWWHWQAPSNTWVKSDKGDSLAKYLVKDGSSWKVGTPPS